MKAIGIAAAMVLASAGTAYAGDWVAIAENREAIVATDRASIIRSGGDVTAWVTFAFYETSTRGPKPLDYFLMRMRFDCDAMTQSYLSYVGYTLAGEVVGQESGEARPTPVVPDTTWANVAGELCSNSPGEGEPSFATSGAFARSVRDVAAQVVQRRQELERDRP